MANTRCFDSYNAKLSASDLSREKKQTTIYNEIQKNVQQFNTSNPVKKNGNQYNKNTLVNSSCDISSGYVETALNYELLASVKQGAALVYPVQVSTPKYESWCGNLYSVDYLQHGVTNVVEASANNIVIDPSYVLFYDNCEAIYYNSNKPEQWTTVVDLSFQNTYFAIEANNLNVCPT
jgi:hypothetical protein